MKQSLLSLGIALAVTIVSSFLGGCGGGTSGTGVESLKSTYIEGIITTPEGEAISGANITLVQNGAVSRSGPDGRFSIVADNTPDTVDLTINSDSFEQTISVEKPDLKDGHAVQLSIRLDPRRRRISVKKLDVSVEVKGACDIAFENRRVIRQSNHLPNGTVCRIRVAISGDGQPLAHIPFVMQRASCSRDDWNPIAAGETGHDLTAGTGALEFRYQTGEKDCRYRVLIPYEVPGLNQLAFYIDTFQKQEFDQDQ